ncbi:MAG TPA: oligosaccharide flippase family protein [Terriglobales bacterium]|jgi:PST family polysaccharide transporter
MSGSAWAAWAWRGDLAVWAAAWLTLGLVWLGYPAVLAVWARWRRRGGRGWHDDVPAAAWPFLSIIVAAHNEAEQIGGRIANLRGQDYPAGRFEILVAEDGSTDGTVAEVERLAAAGGAPVRRLSLRARAGKAAALNRAAAAATGEVLIFTDANNSFAPGALRHLAAPFADATVGAVTGLKAVDAAVGVGGGESLYWRYESRLTLWESAAGGTVAAYGEALALRRECFRGLPEGVLVNDDLCLALGVWAQGMRVVAAPAARSFERGAADMRAEWERRRRMAAGHWQALAGARQWGRWPLTAGIKIWFHQILRPLSALFLLAALGCGLALLAAPGGVVGSGVRLLALAEAVAGAAVLGVGLAHAAGMRLGRLEAPWFFCLALAAAAAGWWQHRRGGGQVLWRRVARARPAEAMADEIPGSSTGRILSGLFWAASSFVGGKLLVFASVVILARILAPQAFGEVALATTSITVLEILGTLGLTSALIYEEKEWRAAANICFWVTLATSGAEMVGAWFLAPVLGEFFHEPGLAAMIRSLAVVLVFIALGNTHDFVLRRRLDFRTKLVPDLGQAAAKGGTSVVLALLGFGAWSLIWGQVLGSFVVTVLLWRLSGWRPERRVDRAVLRRMVDYAKHIYLLDGSSVLLANFDTLTIGRMLSDAWLGFYTLAFRIPEIALVSVLNVITRVVFPAFSRLQNDRPQLRATLLDTMRYTALLTLPVAAGLAVLARGVVLGVYGPHWGPSIPVLRVLAIYCGVRCLIHHFGDGYKAIGRPDVLTRTTLCWWVMLPPCLILGAHWGGIVGVAWGQVVTRVVMSLLHVYLIGKYLQIGAWALLRAVAPALEATAVMATILTMALPWANHWAPRLELAALVPLGAVVYLGMLWLRHPQVVRAAAGKLRRPQPATAAPEMAA